MAFEAISNKKLQQLNFGNNGDDEDPNQPVDLTKACEVEFIVRKRRTRPKDKVGKTNQGKWTNGNIQEIPRNS